MLLPTTSFVVLMTAIGSLQLFAEPYVMTQGGPGDATRSLVLLMYEQGFRWWNLGLRGGDRVRAVRDRGGGHLARAARLGATLGAERA